MIVSRSGDDGVRGYEQPVPGALSTHARGTSAAGAGVLPMVVAALVALLVVSPRTAPLVMAAATVWAAYRLHTRGALLRKPELPTWLLVAPFALGFWALVSASWAPDSWHSAGKSALVLLAAIELVVLLSVARHLGSAEKEGMRQGLVLGMALCGAVLAFEVFTDQLILRTVYTHFPSVRQPYERHVKISDGIIVAAGDTNINRRVFTFTLLLLPALMIAAHQARGYAYRVGLGVMLASTVLIVTWTKHQSSQLFLAAALAMFLFHKLVPSLTRPLIYGAVLANLIFWIPAALMAERHKLDEAPWLFASARHRVIVWADIAGQIVENPWRGVGIDGGQTIEMLYREKLKTGEAELKNGFTRIARHAHNIYLQTWYELGVVGALLLGVIGWMSARTIATLPSRDVGYLAAFMFGAMAGLAASYSPWQPWILALLPLTAVTFVVGREQADTGCFCDGYADRAAISQLTVSQGKVAGLDMPIEPCVVSVRPDGDDSAAHRGWSREVAVSTRIWLFVAVVTGLAIGASGVLYLGDRTRSTPTNLALFRTASTSSTCSQTHPAEIGNDGNLEGSKWFCTLEEDAPWWQVDLGAIMLVGSVRLYNRTDCCRDAPPALNILVSQNGKGWTLVHSHSKRQFGAPPLGEALSIDLGRHSARFVRVQLASKGYLHLAEVQVFGP